MDLVSVLTTARTPSYLKETLAGLEADTANLKRVVYVDGHHAVTGASPDSLEAPASVFLGKVDASWSQISSSHKPLGNLRAFFAVCRFAYEIHADRLLYFEDDIRLSPNAIPRMLQTGVPDDCAWTTFFDMKEIAPGTPPGLYRVSAAGADGKGWWGFQAAMIPKRTLIWLLKHSNEILREADAAGVVHCADYFAGHCMLRSPWPDVAVHVPSLVEHIGANTSSIWPQEGQYEVKRTAKDFLGSEDALKLSQDTQARGRVVEDITQTLLPGNATKTAEGVWKPISQEQHDFLKVVLAQVRANGFLHAPIVLDRKGDKTLFSHIKGDRKYQRSAERWPAHILREVGALIAAFHRAEPRLCHGDLAPWNVVFRNEVPTALIDFKKAHYGSQVEDFAYAAWTWLTPGLEESPRGVLECLRILREETPYSVQRIARALRSVLKRHMNDPETRSWATPTHEWCESVGFYDVE